MSKIEALKYICDNFHGALIIPFSFKIDKTLNLLIFKISPILQTPYPLTYNSFILSNIIYI